MIGKLAVSVAAGLVCGVLGWIWGGALAAMAAYAFGGAFALLLVSALCFAAANRAGGRPQARGDGLPALGRGAR